MRFYADDVVSVIGEVGLKWFIMGSPDTGDVFMSCPRPTLCALKSGYWMSVLPA